MSRVEGRACLHSEAKCQPLPKGLAAQLSPPRGVVGSPICRCRSGFQGCRVRVSGGGYQGWAVRGRVVVLEAQFWLQG